MPIRLYWVDLNNETVLTQAALLPLEERHFAQTFRNETLKKQRLIIKIRLRQILASYLNAPMDKIRLERTPYGKPYLVDYPEIQFNISHSNDKMLVAISEIGVIGVDIEGARNHQPDFAAVVKKCFAHEEINYWQNLPEAEKLSTFYRFWTAKEAFVKAVGRGLALGLQHCVVDLTQNAYFTHIPNEYGTPENWRLFELTLEKPLYGAVVVANKLIEVNFRLPALILFND